MRINKYHDTFLELGFRFLRITCGGPAEEYSEYIYRNGELPEGRLRRLDFLAEVVNCLVGAYKRREGHIRNWFYRNRRELNGRIPFDFLHGDWNPEDPGPQKVLSLAKSLRDGNAT